MARHERRLSFSVRIVPVPSITEAAGRRLAREWSDHADALGLTLEGTPLQWRVSSAERSLSEVDQVDVLDWWADQASVAELRLSPLAERGDAATQLRTGHVCLRRSDPCTAALRFLDRQGRLTASMVFQGLGGFVRLVVNRRADA